MKELKETKPLWAKRNSRLVDNCVKGRKQKAGGATHPQGREVGGDLCPQQPCSVCSEMIGKTSHDLSVKTGDGSTGGKKRKPTCETEGPHSKPRVKFPAGKGSDALGER